MVSFQLARKTPPEIVHETSPSPTPTTQTLVDDGTKRAPTGPYKWPYEWVSGIITPYKWNYFPTTATHNC